MSSHAAPRRSNLWRTIRSTRVRALLSLGIVFGFGSGGTMAYWTDSATVTGATFTAGTINIRLTDSDLTTTTLANITMGSMVPGSSAAQTVKVKNTGTANFTYQVNGSYSDGVPTGLGSAMRFNIYTGATANAGNTACSGGTPVLVSTGTALAGTALANNMLGSARTLTGTPPANETLCVQAFLPTDADTALQGKTTTATLTFAATSAP